MSVDCEILIANWCLDEAAARGLQPPRASYACENQLFIMVRRSFMQSKVYQNDRLRDCHAGG